MGSQSVDLSRATRIALNTTVKGFLDDPTLTVLHLEGGLSRDLHDHLTLRLLKGKGADAVPAFLRDSVKGSTLHLIKAAHPSQQQGLPPGWIPGDTSRRDHWLLCRLPGLPKPI